MLHQLLDPSSARALATHDWDVAARETPLEAVQGLGAANELWAQAGTCNMMEDTMRSMQLQAQEGRIAAQQKQAMDGVLHDLQRKRRAESGMPPIEDEGEG